MGFIQKNVNFGLLFLIIVLAVSIASIGVYYNQNYAYLSDEYHNKINALQRVQNDLLFHKTRLNQTATDLKIKEQDESELNRRYTKIRDAKEKLDIDYDNLKLDLNKKNVDLLAKTNDLISARSEIASQKISIVELNDDISQYETRISSYKSKLSDVCSACGAVCDENPYCD
ncbi:MAG: hypothetical protein KAK00_06265 [Nanoarchaeota archaeon]|nr:hypothetical protein [Nanoarchaeota archaeon]